MESEAGEKFYEIHEIVKLKIFRGFFLDYWTTFADDEIKGSKAGFHSTFISSK